MRAMLVQRFGDPEQMSLEDLPAPEPGPGEILIDARAIGVNFPDLLVIEGRYQILPELPFSPGKEVAGVVEAVGSCVSGLRVGQRVMAQIEYGGYSEKVIAPAANVTVIPSEMRFEEASAFGLIYLTAYFALVHRARLQPDEVVLVTGAAGGVGSAGVQLAKAFGASVIAVASTEEKRAFALSMGADYAIEPDLKTFKERVRGLTDGRGADIILETVGGELFDACLRTAAWEGRLVVIGFASGRIPVVKAGHVLVKNISLIGLQISDYRDREPDSFQEAQEVLLNLYEKGSVSVPIATTYPLEAAADALQLIRSSKVRGKTVLTTDSDG